MHRRFAEAGVGVCRVGPASPAKAPAAANTVRPLVAPTCAESPHKATHSTGRNHQNDRNLSLLGAAHLAGAAVATAPHTQLQTLARSRLCRQALRSNQGRQTMTHDKCATARPIFAAFSAPDGTVLGATCRATANSSAPLMPSSAKSRRACPAMRSSMIMPHTSIPKWWPGCPAMRVGPPSHPEFRLLTGCGRKIPLQ